jgi:hypothetical protein
MDLSPDQVVSAFAVLIPSSGKPLDGHARITSENVSEYTPSAEAVASVAQAFRRLGFQTDTTAGTGVSIIGAVEAFEKTFGTQLQPGAKGGIVSVPKGAPPALELPLELLPSEIRSVIQTVTFAEPPDFGPM